MICITNQYIVECKRDDGSVVGPVYDLSEDEAVTEQYPFGDIEALVLYARRNDGEIDDREI